MSIGKIICVYCKEVMNYEDKEFDKLNGKDCFKCPFCKKKGFHELFRRLA